MTEEKKDPKPSFEDQLSEQGDKSLYDEISRYLRREKDYKLRLVFLEQRVAEAEKEIKELYTAMVTEVVDVAVAKLSPSASDLVIFWLPKRFTQDDAFKAGQALGPVIDNRFKFTVFVKGSVDIQLIEGSKDILLP